MRRVVFNQKGGVGKTSITCNLAAISASRGKRTLVIDLDTQANSTQYLLGDAEYDCSIADYLDQKVGFFEVAKPVNEFVFQTEFDNLFIMPACKRLPEIEHKLESRYKIFALKKALKALEEFYDEIYIDTPPALNFYTKSALIATDSVLIPFDCDAFSKSSLESVSSAISEIKEDHNDNLAIEGIIVNQFQPRAKLPLQLVNELVEAGYPVLTSRLTSSVKMKESHQQSCPLIHFAPKHNLTKQFETLYDELNNVAQ